MYSQLNIVKCLKPKAEQFILDNDRMLYLPFFEATEKFCAERDILFGGRVGIDLLVGRPVTKDSFFWDLYCDDTFNNAKELALSLSQVTSHHVPARTVALQTDIRHKEFTIRINARTLFKIYSLDRYRGLKLADLMGPAIRTSYFTKIPIKCISEEIQLIEIYRTLYTPAKLSLWENELDAEETIYEMIKDSVGEKATKEITGGAVTRFDKIALEQDILRKVIANSNIVLIGDHALAAFSIEQSPSRIQIISEEPIDKIARAVESVVTKNIKGGFRGSKVTIVRYMINIPSDFQITKHSLYINTGKEQIPLADVFNSSEFELIPWWPGSGSYANIKIGNPWVLLRFQFIDIWILKLILNIGTDNPEFIKNKIRAIATRADSIRKLALDQLKTNPEKIFQLNNYVGYYVSEQVAKKKLIKEIGERFNTYYPAKVAETSGGNESTNIIESATQAGFKPLFNSAPIDLFADAETKRNILRQIIPGIKSYDNILHVLRAHYGAVAEYRQWGVVTSHSPVQLHKDSFLPWVPNNVNTHLDVGCGDGFDIATRGKKYLVTHSVCADSCISGSKTKTKVTELGPFIPTNLLDLTVDLVTAFFVLHHSADVESRLKDLFRVMKPGGVLMIRDHDVNTKEQAAAVDFEHLVYDLGGESKIGVDEMIKKYHDRFHMYYYSANQITEFLTSLGFECLFFEELNDITRIYNAVYIKK